MDRYAVIVTGDRHGTFEQWGHLILEAVAPAKPDINPFVLIHGDAPGVDTVAASVIFDSFNDFGAVILPEPADWDRAEKLLGNRNAAGPLRNKKMLTTLDAFRRAGWKCAVLGFHPFIHNSKGTSNMLNIAVDEGFPAFIHNLKGERERWTR